MYSHSFDPHLINSKNFCQNYKCHIPPNTRLLNNYTKASRKLERFWIHTLRTKPFRVNFTYFVNNNTEKNISETILTGKRKKKAKLDGGANPFPVGVGTAVSSPTSFSRFTCISLQSGKATAHTMALSLYGILGGSTMASITNRVAISTISIGLDGIRSNILIKDVSV